uniref:Uncharacterized protein n=1 Tax=Tanacetum cinerariifolium TaxID=118510 RepID=A0A6L2KSC2_TANCI|nr:hypothetical protein [Tanacetum cinerariifolium]
MKKLADIYFKRVTQTAESIFSLSPRHMALWQSQIEDHTSDWLRVVLISGLGQTMNGKAYRCVLCYRLGVPCFLFQTCAQLALGCSRGDIHGDHPSGVSVGKKVDIGLSGGREKPVRPEDMLLYSWDIRLDELEKDVVALLKRIQKFSVTQDIEARVAAHFFNRLALLLLKE